MNIFSRIKEEPTPSPATPPSPNATHPPIPLVVLPYPNADTEVQHAYNDLAKDNPSPDRSVVSKELSGAQVVAINYSISNATSNYHAAIGNNRVTTVAFDSTDDLFTVNVRFGGDSAATGCVIQNLNRSLRIIKGFQPILENAGYRNAEPKKKEAYDNAEKAVFDELHDSNPAYRQALDQIRDFIHQGTIEVTKLNSLHSITIVFRKFPGAEFIWGQGEAARAVA